MEISRRGSTGGSTQSDGDLNTDGHLRFTVRDDKTTTKIAAGVFHA